MEMVEEIKESPQVNKFVFSDPGSPPSLQLNVSIRSIGKIGETGVIISASLGAMRPLVGKLSLLLLAPVERRFSSRVENEMRLLKHDVEEITSYLDELSEVEDPPATAKCWMNEARDLSYDMEDYVNSLLSVQPEDHSLVANNIKTTRSLGKCFSHAKTLKKPKWDDHKIEQTLSEFRMNVQEAIGRHQRYGLHSCSALRRRFVPLGPMLLPTPYEETADTVIDGRMNDFVNSLANDGDQQLRVASILGSACLGKTTLARVFYDKFGRQYNCRAFIRVSKKPDMKRTFSDMLLQLQKQHPPQDCKEVVLIENIKKYLQDKRYLIILDDVWATSVWDIISHAFPNGSHGSRIITTTQIEDVALTCCSYQSGHVFEMKPLDDDHSRKLFFGRLFGSENHCPEQFKEVLEKIVETCGGLPLATISIASLVASQPIISTGLLAYIYHSLSSCSMYPAGYKFWKDDLVKQWMAECFIHIPEGQDMYEAAQSYLNQLIGRRFIQPICVNHNNEVVSCMVHDMVHDIIAHNSAEENFTVAVDYGRRNVPLSHKARRLSLLFGDAKYGKTPANIRKSQVRSLTFFGLFKCISCIREFKLLRVLNLQLSGHGHGDGHDRIDLTRISELFQLRYLKIACDVCIELPNHGLKLLETLDISEATVILLRNVHLPRLLHLSLLSERNLPDWYVDMRALTLNYCLQDLHLSCLCRGPYEEKYIMGFLVSLFRVHRFLKTIVVAHGSSAVKELVFPLTSYLPISLEIVEHPRHLQRFEFSPHCGILFSRIPTWVKELANLCILKIAVKEIYQLEVLRALPSLTALSLYVETAPLHMIIFDTGAGFSVLKYFKLRCTTGIAQLKFEADSMPNLTKLKLVFDAIPPMDRLSLLSFSKQSTLERGTALITIEHMPGLREISAKFGGAAAADLEFASRTVFSNHPSNPTINMQLVDHSSCGDESTRRAEILEEEPSESSKTQPDECDNKQDEILEEPYNSKIRKRAAGRRRISRSSKFSALLHFQGASTALKKGLVYFGWDREKEPGHSRKDNKTMKGGSIFSRKDVSKSISTGAPDSGSGNILGTGSENVLAPLFAETRGHRHYHGDNAEEDDD
ncbi:disease resistance protein RGA5-like [Lolium rigidum]|uniref:disease resistance protein RGA5-like n=1 Tax=Lolium rigidum TaxID=89674 RepID=UPI001F5CD101|nr:disease resistance protein RGA5-like [Lolium rigidum]